MLDNVMPPPDAPSHDEIVAYLAGDPHVERLDLSSLRFDELDPDIEYGFEQCVINNVKIKGDALIGSEWRDCEFMSCEFTSCNLREAVFENCHFFNVQTAEGTVFRFCDLENARFDACDLSVCGFHSNDAYDVQFSQCKMVGFQFEKTDCSHDFGKLKRNVAMFNDCTMINAVLREADLSTCVLKDCDLSDADLSFAVLTSAELTECNLYGVDFTGCDLSGSDLRGSTLDGFDLTTLKAYQGLQISAGQQHLLLTSIGIDVFAD